ncbi:DegV family protein [Paraclostridium ghonii]|uniref:DegV family protein with EDD domain n=1 Tax=Paraclostridium ghonii TaxID=29358 RepID=A0ABU0MXR9_9FIRM|nr:DegV family protein [Paeniclostridium ghonii]MDQ0555707.1 DegV family protein with EDD domain [Paeniclostridium ghonii]
MKKIKIITDSSCDLNIELIQKYDIGIVNLNVSFGDETYADGEMDNNTFYNRMASSKELPKTSCPSPEKFADMYNCEEDEVLVLTLSSKLSATYSTAVLAKNMFEEENSEKRIEVIDTANGSVGQGLLVIKAAQLAKEGKSLEEIVNIIEDLKEKVVFYGSLETLENAIKGGRVNPLAGKLINALNFKVIIQVVDGIVKPVDKARGDSNSVKKVIENIYINMDDEKKYNLAIGHSNCEDKALKVKEIMSKEYDFEDITISSVGSVMGTYTSKGAILISIL